MIECTCEHLSDGEGPSVVRECIRKARKSHRCDECGGEIAPGSLYEHVTGCWDGRWVTHKTCMICRQIRQDFFPCAFYYGELWSSLREQYGYEPWLDT